MTNTHFTNSSAPTPRYGATVAKAAISASVAGAALGLWNDTALSSPWLLCAAGAATLLSLRWTKRALELRPLPTVATMPTAPAPVRPLALLTWARPKSLGLRNRRSPRTPRWTTNGRSSRRRASATLRSRKS